MRGTSTFPSKGVTRPPPSHFRLGEYVPWRGYLVPHLRRIAWRGMHGVIKPSWTTCRPGWTLGPSPPPPWPRPRTAWRVCIQCRRPRRQRWSGPPCGPAPSTAACCPPPAPLGGPMRGTATPAPSVWESGTVSAGNRQAVCFAPPRAGKAAPPPPRVTSLKQKSIHIKRSLKCVQTDAAFQHAHLTSDSHQDLHTRAAAGAAALKRGADGRRSTARALSARRHGAVPNTVHRALNRESTHTSQGAPHALQTPNKHYAKATRPYTQGQPTAWPPPWLPPAGTHPTPAAAPRESARRAGPAGARGRGRSTPSRRRRRRHLRPRRGAPRPRPPHP